jgi:hypothetical protein
MSKYLARILLFLTIALSAGPVDYSFLTSEVSSGCSDSCCNSGPSQKEEDSSPTGICNPYQCHNCCFVIIPSISFPIIEENFTKPTYSPFFGERYLLPFSSESWQPPRLLS